MTTAVAKPLGTRAVMRPVVAGRREPCDHCKEEILWRARQVMWIVYANVYGRDGDPNRWDRTEVFHLDCYRELKQPYGPASKK